MTASCYDLAREGLIHAGCCDSCHEDADEWGFDLIEFELPDGRTAHVCCRVYEAMLEAVSTG